MTNTEELKRLADWITNLPIPTNGATLQLMRLSNIIANMEQVAPPAGEMPALPETHYNGSGDGSEPLYTPDMVHLYAIQYAEQQAGTAIHYPECWDTAAYPTLASAIREIGAFKCSTNECEHTAQPASSDTDLLDFLDRDADVVFDLEHARIGIDIPECFQGANTVREIIQAAITLQEGKQT